jgi:hypothetical protein
MVDNAPIEQRKMRRSDHRLMVTLTAEQVEEIRAIAEKEVLPVAALLRRWVVQELRRQRAAENKAS